MEDAPAILQELVISLPPHGIVTTLWPNGRIRASGQYVAGKKRGVWNYYDENTGKLCRTDYWNAEGFLHGQVKEIWPNGNNKMMGKYVNDIKDGEWMWFGLDGKLSIRGSYLHGETSGLWTYFDSGHIVATGDLIHGVQIGEWRFYYPLGGELRETGAFVNGLRVGKWTTYYRNKRIQRTVDMVTGECSTFDENLNKVMHGYVSAEGIPFGEWIFYDTDGSVMSVEHYAS